MQYRNYLVGTVLTICTIFLVLSFNYRTTQQMALAGDITPTSANYLPIIVKPPPTPTPTFTPTATPMPTVTPTPTATATDMPPPADVRITLIVYNPAGDDVQGEYVRLQNFGGTTAVMSGWTLRDNSAHVFTFPGSFSLAPGGSVQVWTKSGSNTAANLYYNSAQAIWNNTGDTAFLRNNGGTLVDSCSYSGGGTQAGC